MTETPTYYLIRYCHGRAGFTAYAQRTNIFHIPEFHTFQITRYYPYPSLNLTPRLARFQRLIRRRLALRRWCGHPKQLQYRSLYGRFPPLPPHLR